MRIQQLLRSLLLLLGAILLIIVGIYGNRGVPDFRAVFSDKLNVLRSLEQSILQLSPLAVVILIVIIVLIAVGLWQSKRTRRTSQSDVATKQSLEASGVRH